MNVLLALLIAWSARGDVPQLAGSRTPEAVEMVSAILKGSQMGPGAGWFHATESRYGWKWLADRFDTDKDNAVDFDEFKGTESAYDRLDRNRDGVIKADDFDWSDDAIYLNAIAPFSQMFRRFDGDSNGLVTREEWMAFFDRAAAGHGNLAPEEFRVALSPAPAPRRRKFPDLKLSGPPPGAPTTMMLLEGLLKGEIGSPFEGPKLGQPAPDFTLKTRDNKGNITLSGYQGKPVVLVFGSFT